MFLNIFVDIFKLTALIFGDLVPPLITRIYTNYVNQIFL